MAQESGAMVGLFVALSDPFEECHFSKAKVSLGYNVLRRLNFSQNLLFCLLLLPFHRNADRGKDGLARDRQSIPHANSKLHLQDGCLLLAGPVCNGCGGATV
jgi:hypothetical protein